MASSSLGDPRASGCIRIGKDRHQRRIKIGLSTLHPTGSGNEIPNHTLAPAISVRPKPDNTDQSPLAGTLRSAVASAYGFSAVSQASDIAFYVLLFKFLPLEEVGHYSLVIAVMAFVGLILDLGISPGLTREFSQHRTSFWTVLREVSLLRLPGTLGCAVAFGVWLVLTSAESDLRLAILFAGFIQIIRTVTTVLTSWLRAAELQPKANLIQSLSAVGRLTAGLALLWAWDVTSVPVLFAGLLGTELIVAVVTWSTWGELPQRRSAPADIMALRHRLRVLVLTFGAITLFTVLQNRLDWLMVSYFLSTKALADYSMANKWYEISVAMAGLAVVSAFPWMCRERGWLGLELAAFLRLVLVIVGFVSILGALAGPEALRVIWDAKYAGSDAAMRLLMLAVTLSVFDGILYHLLIAKGAERYTLFVLVLATVTQGVVNVTLIPAIGIQGAALGMVGLVTVTGLLYTRRASRELKRLGWPTVTYLILIPVGGWLILHTLDGLFHRVLFGLGVWFIASSGLLYKDRTTLAHILKHS